MANFKSKVVLQVVLSLAVVTSLVSGAVTVQAQAPAAAPAAGPKLGTVKAVTGNTITVLTDAPTSQTITITVPDGAKVQQLAVGSTDLKTATAGQMSDVAVGDRVLSSVKPGDSPTSFTASRVVLMKSGDIAQKNAAEQMEWRKNGTGGIVSAVDASTGMLTVTAGAKKVVVSTSAKTDFRRFAVDSQKFQDAKPGTMAQIQVGDQIQARGTKAADGLSVTADQVVSGSFKNLSGVITSLDASSGKITLKDLATKKVMTVTVTGNSDVRKMPAQMAAMFSARVAGGGGAGGAAAAGAGGPGGGGGGGRGPGGAGGGAPDLGQMIGRMPTGTLADLKNGDAVMIVASEPTPGATSVTAVTLLSGVEPILTANPNGGMSLGMSLGGGAGAE